MSFKGSPRGARLAAVVQTLTDQGLKIGGQSYKKVPTGLPTDHPRADWLRFGGLFAAVDQPLPPATFSDQLPGLCFEHFRRVAPLQQWLVDLLAD